MMHIRSWGLCTLLLVFAMVWLSGCTPEATDVAAAPTLAAVFQVGDTNATPTARSTQFTLATAAPSTVVATPTPGYQEVVIFDERLSPGWTVDFSEQVALDREDTTHWFETLNRAAGTDAGAVSLLVTPQEGWGTVRFTLEADATVSYARERVQGVSFWLNSNNSYMSNDALVVTIVGSNERSYWTPNDTSALTEVGYFPEIPLYDLAINDAIPPNTWVQVILSMDKLLFGPEYEYVTGIIVKTKSFQNRAFHIDRVALLVGP